MSSESIELLKAAVDNFDIQVRGMSGLAMNLDGTLAKAAFAPAPPPAGPMMAPPPGDPGAMPPGAPPPGDPNAMPPGPPPPGDPNAAPPGPPPPGDPNAAPPQGPPPPQQGGLDPGLEQVLGDLANGVQSIASVQEQNQAAVDQLAKQVLAISSRFDELENRMSSMKEPQEPAGDLEAAPPDATMA